MKYTLPQGVTLFHADCRDALRSLPSDSIDSVPCDPPYELNFMGKGWDDTGIANDPALWAEVFRVLKPGGHLAAFSASRTYHRMACAIEDAGFEIRDSLMWIYGTGFPKSQNVSAFIDKMAGAERPVVGQDRNFGTSKAATGKNAFGDYAGEWNITAPVTPAAIEFDGFGTALKPAFEPIVLARKPLSEPTVAANVLRWRTGALNIGACRIPGEPWKAHDATGLGSVKFFSEGDTPVIHKEPHNAGRWPANVVHDGSDEVVGMFPNTKSGAWNEGMQQRATDGVAKGAEQARVRGAREPDAGSAARFFYSAKASKADRNGSKHPTVKPIALMEWLAKLITPPGGTILDPFAGSGTTGIAATRCGFRAVLCEREAEYVRDIRARFAPSRPSLFLDLDAVRRELELLPLVAALRARLCA